MLWYFFMKSDLVENLSRPCKFLKVVKAPLLTNSNCDGASRIPEMSAPILCIVLGFSLLPLSSVFNSLLSFIREFSSWILGGIADEDADVEGFASEDGWVKPWRNVETAILSITDTLCKAWGPILDASEKVPCDSATKIWFRVMRGNRNWNRCNFIRSRRVKRDSCAQEIYCLFACSSKFILHKFAKAI